MKIVRALPNNWEIIVYVFVMNATKFPFFPLFLGALNITNLYCFNSLILRTVCVACVRACMRVFMSAR